MTDIINIHTHGSCPRNPGPGGYAAIINFGASHTPAVLTSTESETTQNRIELTAAAAALVEIPRGASVKLYSNSNILVRAMNNGWTDKWQTNSWKSTIKGEK